MDNPTTNNEPTAVDILEHWVKDDKIAGQITKVFAAAHTGSKAFIVMDARLEEDELFERLVITDDEIQTRTMFRMTGTQHLTLGSEEGAFAILPPDDQSAVVKIIELISTREDNELMEVGGTATRSFPSMSEEDSMEESSLQTKVLEDNRAFEFLIDDESHVFQSDHRKEKPGLHMMYVESALVHLRFLDATLTRLHNFSNIHMLEVATTLEGERAKLIRENASYAQANKMLHSLNLKPGITLIDEEGRSPEGPMDLT